MEVREVLEGMLEILQEKEWIKGKMYSYPGKMHDAGGFIPPAGFLVEGVCLEGACNLTLFSQKGPLDVVGWIPLKVAVRDLILAAAETLFPDKFEDWMKAMFQFNDWEPVTREDVILAVKHAIGEAVLSPP